MNLLRDIERQIKVIEGQPPVPRAMYARHDVPPWKVMRMWNTRGELIVYVNRCHIEALKAQTVELGTHKLTVRTHPALGDLGVFGIPVVFEGPDAHMHIRYDGTPVLSTHL